MSAHAPQPPGPSSLVRDLCAAVPELVETHISWVFLGDGEVWKVKKPVDFGFLDFSTPERRRRACEAEVELNRRLAPGVYLGVVPVVRRSDGRHRFGEGAEGGGADAPAGGEVVDWAVHMVRLPEAARADRLLAAERLGPAEVDRVAVRLAAFHAAARCDEETARYGTVAAIGRNVRENFAQTRDTVHEHLSAAEAAEVEAWQNGFLAAEAERFAARIAAGRVRDGHGDLRLEHVYLDAVTSGAGDGAGEGAAGGVTVVDCIEFNERFRYADVCADVAFLAMDLTWQGRADLAERLLATYAREANDFDLYPLVDFYESYRAYVRAKVSSMLAADAAADADARERAGREARRYYLLALASERRSLLPPAVVAVGGVIASGKSTVAEHVAALRTAPIVEADRTRKFLLGAAPTDKVHVPPWQGPYSPEVTARVYAELRRRARAVVGSGRPVVVDASFRDRGERRAVRALAQELGVPFCFVECRAPVEVCRERLRRRDRERGVSDGRLEIFADFVARWEPVDELPAAEHLVLDTTLPVEESLDLVRRRLATWPAGLTS